MTDPEVSACLHCDLPACDGGSPACPWGQAHWRREKQRHYAATFRERNREKRTAQHREYRARNRDKINATRRALYWRRKAEGLRP